MSEQTLTDGDLYCRPTEIDDGAYLRIRQVRPVERAASPIIDHNIELTETALSARPWYRGKRQVEIDRQDKCWAIWEAGQRKDGVIALAGKRRVSRSNVFEYYKRELKGIGVKNASDFVAILKRREKRLSRVKLEP